jgi:hypothetical protein
VAAKEYDLLPDGTIDLSQPGISTLFEDQLDAAHTVQPSALASLRGEDTSTAAEREHVERQCAQWCVALRDQLREALRGHGITVSRVRRELDWTGYHVTACETHARHRDYSVDIEVGEALSISELHDREPLAAVTLAVIEKIFAARDKYHQRAGLL